MVNDNTFAVMGRKTIKIFSRPQLVYVPPAVPVTSALVEAKPAKKKWMSKKEKAAAAAAEAEASLDVSAATSIASSVTEKKYNEFALTGKINIFQGASMTRFPKLPTILTLVSKDKLLVGFDDGSAQIVYSPALLDPASVKPAAHGSTVQVSLGDGRKGEDESKSAAEPAAGTMAAVLCEFQAHFVAENGYRSVAYIGSMEEEQMTRPPTSGTAAADKDDLSEPDLTAYEKPLKPSLLGVRAAVVCPWSNCSGGPGLGYQLELLTIGSDRRVAHWGVRFRPGQSDVVLEPHYSSATRVSTANPTGMGDDEDDEPPGFEDSMSLYSARPGTKPRVELPMEPDLLGVRQQRRLHRTNTFR
jgi:hypothetical protein